MKKQLLLVALFYLTAAVLTLHFFRNTSDIRSLRRHKADLLGEISVLKGRVAGLQRQVEALEKDPFYIERVAREELGWTRAGEREALCPRFVPEADRRSPASNPTRRTGHAR